MKIRTTLTAAALALAAVAAPAHALTLAVLDAQQVINNTNAAKRAITDLESQRKSAQAKVQALEAPLVEKQKKLMEQRNVMAADKLKAAEEDLRKDIIAFRTEAQKIQEQLETSNLQVRKKIADAVRQSVDAIAKEKGYDVVVPKSLVLYSGANVPDITADALARTNALLK